MYKKTPSIFLAYPAKRLRFGTVRNSLTPVGIVAKRFFANARPLSDSSPVSAAMTVI